MGVVTRRDVDGACRIERADGQGGLRSGRVRRISPRTDPAGGERDASCKPINWIDGKRNLCLTSHRHSLRQRRCRKRVCSRSRPNNDRIRRRCRAARRVRHSNRESIGSRCSRNAAQNARGRKVEPALQGPRTWNNRPGVTAASTSGLQCRLGIGRVNRTTWKRVRGDRQPVGASLVRPMSCSVVAQRKPQMRQARTLRV